MSEAERPRAVAPPPAAAGAARRRRPPWRPGSMPCCAGSGPAGYDPKRRALRRSSASRPRISPCRRWRAPTRRPSRRRPARRQAGAGQFLRLLVRALRDRASDARCGWRSRASRVRRRLQGQAGRRARLPRRARHPYAQLAADQPGRVAIDWGLYGVPETYLIDKQGIIRWRWAGPLPRTRWRRNCCRCSSGTHEAGLALLLCLLAGPVLAAVPRPGRDAARPGAGGTRARDRPRAALHGLPEPVDRGQRRRARPRPPPHRARAGHRRPQQHATSSATCIDRYGDFVLLRPPVKPETYLLWAHAGHGARPRPGDDRHPAAPPRTPARRRSRTFPPRSVRGCDRSRTAAGRELVSLLAAARPAGRGGAAAARRRISSAPPAPAGGGRPTSRSTAPRWRSWSGRRRPAGWTRRRIARRPSRCSAGCWRRPAEAGPAGERPQPLGAGRRRCSPCRRWRSACICPAASGDALRPLCDAAGGGRAGTRRCWAPCAPSWRSCRPNTDQAREGWALLANAERSRGHLPAAADAYRRALTGEVRRGADRAARRRCCWRKTGRRKPPRCWPPPCRRRRGISACASWPGWPRPRPAATTAPGRLAGADRRRAARGAVAGDGRAADGRAAVDADRGGAALTPARLSPHHRGALRQGLQLAEGAVARQVLHAAIGRRHQPLRRQHGKAGADALGHLLRRSPPPGAEVDHAEHDRLPRQRRAARRGRAAAAPPRSRSAPRALGELRQEGIAGGLVADHAPRSRSTGAPPWCPRCPAARG